MPTPAPPADPANDDPRHQQAIRALIDAGTKLVQDLVADPALSAADKAEPYERLARSIRRSIALARHVADNPAKSAPIQADRTQSRRHVIRDVENAIDGRPEHPERPESLRDELDERLDDPEFERDLATRSIHDIIRDLKHDLGLERDLNGRYHRRTPADIRAIHARAATKPAPENAPLARDRQAADG